MMFIAKYREREKRGQKGGWIERYNESRSEHVIEIYTFQCVCSHLPRVSNPLVVSSLASLAFFLVLALYNRGTRSRLEEGGVTARPMAGILQPLWK